MMSFFIKMCLKRACGLCGGLALIAILALGACSSPQPRDDVPGAIVVSGTMNYVDIEGGCWVLQVGDEPETMQAYQLGGDNAEELLIDGARVRVQIVPRPKVVSICQIGIVADVITILEVEKPN